MLKTMVALMAGLSAMAIPAAAENADTPGILRGADAAVEGRINVREAPRGVLLRISAKGLPPGWHGIHFHEKGTCSDPGFKESGGHVHDGGTVVHGLLNREGNDFGDLPNVYVGPDGVLEAELFSTFVSLDGAGDRPALRDADGSALVIHANADDHTSQPIGGAGERIACAVIP